MSIAAIIASLLIALGALVSPLTTPVAPEAAAPAPTAEPWTGDGHWYTFQYVTSGLLDSTGRHFKALELPYFIANEEGVAIGKLKGASTNIKLCTRDPEERVIWARTEDFWGTFVRTGVELPVPGPDNCDLGIGTESATYYLSDRARSELEALAEKLETSGEPFTAVPETLGPTFAYFFRDMPWLGYWPFLTLEWLNGRPGLTQWGTDPQTGGLIPERFIPMDSRSTLLWECVRAINSDPD